MVETHEQCKFGQVILTKLVSSSEKLGVIKCQSHRVSVRKHIVSIQQILTFMGCNLMCKELWEQMRKHLILQDKES